MFSKLYHAPAKEKGFSGWTLFYYLCRGRGASDKMQVARPNIYCIMLGMITSGILSPAFNLA